MLEKYIGKSKSDLDKVDNLIASLKSNRSTLQMYVMNNVLEILQRNNLENTPEPIEPQPLY